MKKLALICGWISTSVAGQSNTAGSTETAERPPYIPLHDLTSTEQWNEHSRWLQDNSDLPENLVAAGIEKHTLVAFNSPGCGYCKRLEPHLLDAGKTMENWFQSLFTRIGKVDCSIAKKRCAAYGIYSYPTLLWLDSKGNIVSEFPRGPRQTENILTWLAGELRMREVMPIPDEPDSFDRYYSIAFSECREQRPHHPHFGHFGCLATQMRNLILGSPSAVEKLLQVDPDLVNRHVVWSTNSTVGPMTSMDEVCWLDHRVRSRKSCINSTSENFEREAKQHIRKYANPALVEEANWNLFFEARRELPKLTVLMAGIESHVSDYRQWRREYSLLAQNMSTSMIFLETSNLAPLAKIFEQVGAANESLPWIGAFMGELDKQEFFSFKSRPLEELKSWLEDVMFGREPPFYKADKGWLFRAQNDIMEFFRMARRAWRNSPLHVRLVFGGGLMAVVLGIVAIQVFIPSEEAVLTQIAKAAVSKPVEEIVETEEAAEQLTSPDEETTVRRRN